MQYVMASDGVRIAYLSVGEGAPLVYASNIFGDATRYLSGNPHIVFDVVTRMAGRGWRVIVYDVRGMGASDRAVADLSLEARVRDLAAVVECLDLGQIALAGVDIGAVTAIAYAAAYPSRVSRLALVSPWALGSRYLEIPALRAAYSAEASGDRERKLFGNILMGVASGFDDPAFVKQGTELFLHATSPENLSAYNAANARIDVTALLPRVLVPTLVIHDPAFPFGTFDLCQEVAAGIPGAEFVVANRTITQPPTDDVLDLFARFLGTGTSKQQIPVPHGAAADRLNAATGLTNREVQVLRLVAGGATNKEIASELDIAVATAERHLANLYSKIGARGRADAIAYALRQRLDPPAT